MRKAETSVGTSPYFRWSTVNLPGRCNCNGRRCRRQGGDSARAITGRPKMVPNRKQNRVIEESPLGPIDGCHGRRRGDPIVWQSQGSLASRRHFMCTAGAATLTMAPLAAFADPIVKLPLPGGPDERPITTAFPQKGALILQRTRPPLLETPFEGFDRSVFTPNDRFFVRWHWALIPTEVKFDTFRLAVRGHVTRNLSLTLNDILSLPQVDLVAINQCSGNSRGYFQPRA